MRIRTRLLILVLAILVPSFIAAALAVSYVYREEQKSQVQSVSEATRAFALMVDNELQARAAVLHALAGSPALHAGDLRAFYQHARHVAPTRESVVVLVDLEGRQLINTRQPFGAPLPVRRASNVGALMQRHGPQATLVSDLFMAPIGKRPDYSVQVPVLIDGRLRYHLAVGVNVASLQKLVERQDFRGEWIATIVDRQGVVLARSRHPEQFVGKPIRAYSRERINASAEGIYPSTTLDGIGVRAFFSTVPSAEWKVLVSIPVSEIRRVPLEAAAMLAGLMAALLAAGVLAARWLAQRAIGPIEYLGRSADILGQGKELGYQPQGLVEIDNVALRMGDASRQIRHAQQDLERRVAEAVATPSAYRASCSSRRSWKRWGA
jgi:hypothetical protein